MSGHAVLLALARWLIAIVGVGGYAVLGAVLALFRHRWVTERFRDNDALGIGRLMGVAGLLSTTGLAGISGTLAIGPVCVLAGFVLGARSLGWFELVPANSGRRLDQSQPIQVCER